MSKEQCVTGKASRYHMAGRSLLIHAVAWPVNLHAHDHASQANRSSLDDLPNVMSANPTTRGATAWELGSHNEGCMEPLAYVVSIGKHTSESSWRAEDEDSIKNQGLRSVNFRPPPPPPSPQCIGLALTSTDCWGRLGGLDTLVKHGIEAFKTLD
ncbi:hypothetical protein KC320_g29 [Hortaea werneckii]|nr:hypothetical protein KC320_g29 [Hortaea werneckii]